MFYTIFQMGVSWKRKQLLINILGIDFPPKDDERSLFAFFYCRGKIELDFLWFHLIQEVE